MTNYVRLLQEAKRRVASSPLYRRFIEHTPLENDIAVWMADFAAEQSGAVEGPPQPPPSGWQPIATEPPADYDVLAVARGLIEAIDAGPHPLTAREKFKQLGPQVMRDLLRLSTGPAAK